MSTPAARLTFTALALLAVALPLTACAQPKADTRDYVGKDSTVSEATLRFADAAEGARWKQLRTCFAARSDASWERYPLRKIGNFVTEDACTGHNAHLGCDGGTRRDKPGAASWSVGALHYPQGWPEVFGLHWSLDAYPAGGDLSASISWAEGGKSILGEHLHVTFTEWKDSSPLHKVYLGDGQTWTIAETQLDTKAGISHAELLKRLLASPSSLEAEGLRQLDDLDRRVRDALQKGEVTQCIYGPYKGGGIPPQCIKQQPLPAAEHPAELRTFKTEIDARRDLLKRRSTELHALLTQLYPAACR